MKRSGALIVVAFVAIIVSPLFHTAPAAADGLSIGPLEYKTSLKPGEFKKGFVVIQNQSASGVEVHLRTEAFKQVNDQGGLQFYTDPAVSAGVKLDLDDIEIPTRAGARIYFELDGAKLPSGDVFAAILATTAGAAHAVTIPSVQVGTLLLIENGTPPSHDAAIQNLQAPWLQVGTKLTAQFRVQNTDQANKLTGFEPHITVTSWPYGRRVVSGPLIFAGRSREVAYTQPGNYFGPMLLKVKTGSSEKTQFIFAVTGYWRWLVFFIAAAIVVAIYLVGLLTRRHHAASKSPRDRTRD